MTFPTEVVQAVVLHGCEIVRHGRLVLRAAAPYPLVLAHAVITASAAVADGFYPPTAAAQLRVPKPRTASEAERALIALHEEASALLRDRLGGQAVARLCAMHRTLADRFPDEWLLRWSVLEALVSLGAAEHPTAQSLTRELEHLELRYAHREPIATGLAYLRALTGARSAASTR